MIHPPAFVPDVRSRVPMDDLHRPLLSRTQTNRASHRPRTMITDKHGPLRSSPILVFCLYHSPSSSPKFGAHPSSANHQNVSLCARRADLLHRQNRCSSSNSARIWSACPPFRSQARASGSVPRTRILCVRVGSLFLPGVVCDG